MEATQPLFRKGEEVIHKGQEGSFSRAALCLVLETPATCIFNDVPAYHLKLTLSGSGVAVNGGSFYRGQKDFEADWRSYNPHEAVVRNTALSTEDRKAWNERFAELRTGITQNPDDVKKIADKIDKEAMEIMLDIASKPLFGKSALIKHVKTGNSYIIMSVPQFCRIESTGEPAYAYQGADGLLWVRSQREMEEPGRFVNVNKPMHTNDE